MQTQLINAKHFLKHIQIFKYLIFQIAEDSDFAQHVQWKFEDIKMMIGTDLPIFTDKSSCVSLRLR